MKVLHLIDKKYNARCGVDHWSYGVANKYSFIYSLVPFALCRECLKYALQHRVQRTAKAYAQKLLSSKWAGFPIIVSGATRRR